MISDTVIELRTSLQQRRERLLGKHWAIRPVHEWMQAYQEVIDDTLRQIYAAAWAEVLGPCGADKGAAGDQAEPRRRRGDEPGLALLAVGGYGRGELCPYSDIDIAFVPAEEDNPLIDDVVKEAFRLIVEVMIDGAKMDVSYAYRPAADCERLDYTGKTALLEARPLAGNADLLRTVHQELFRTWDVVAFLLEIAAERREMAQRVPLSLYAVEPNLKEGSGALRDIHTALWVAGAMLQRSDPLQSLEWRGVVTAEDARKVTEARDFLLKLRVWLHLQSGKKTDVLRVAWQDGCARDFAYTGQGALASQRLLRDYYQHAEAASRFLDRVMERLLDGPLPLDDHFVATGRRLRAAHPYTLRNHPELLVAPFALAHKYGFTIDPELDRAIDDALPLMDGGSRGHAIARAGFFALLHDVSTAADALTQLRSRGVLQRLMPEFEAMLQMAPADPSHELTVGEHSIHAVRQLGRLWQRRLTEDELHDVWSGVEDLDLLVLATLLHDVGKIEIGTDHSKSGETIAMAIGTRFGLTPERNARLGLLVRRHLLLPRAARLRDISSPGTIRQAMEQVPDVSALKMLYLLAISDTCAVGERTYSQIDLESMKELYDRVLMAMTREETAQGLTESEEREQLVQRERERLRRQLRHLQLDDAALHRLCDNLPAAYVLNTPLPIISTHLTFLDQLPQDQLIVDFYRMPDGQYTEMTIVAYDERRPGLLSKVCGVVYAVGVEILAAHVYTLPGHDAAVPEEVRTTPLLTSERSGEAKNSTPARDVVLDRLHLVANGRALSESACARLSVQLRDVLLGEQTVEGVLHAAGKDAVGGLLPERISARNDLSDEHTVLTLVSDNAPGLLFHFTAALSEIGLDIHTAKITSWGGRAEDAFYVTHRGDDGQGEKIRDEEIGKTLDALRHKLRGQPLSGGN